MNKKILYFPLICAGLLISATSCTPSQENTYNLTFGTYESDESVRISYSQLATKMDDEESMIVVTYQGETSTCGCWVGFKYAINELVKEEHYLIYKVHYKDFEKHDDFGMVMADDRPGINFVRNGKVVDSILYSTKEVDPLFKSKEALKQAIEKRCNKPAYYYVKPEDLDLKIKSDEKFIACYYWSSCGDCKFAFPNVLYPYADKNTLKIPMYMVNLEVEGILLDGGVKDRENENYQNYLTAHNLNEISGHALGYGRGFVPTFQYYDNGLKDAAVFFNDGVEQINNEYVVTRSFYSKERVKNLHYLDGVNTTVLEGLKLKKEDLNIYEDKGVVVYIGWKQEKANLYHKPLLEAFLNTYAL